MEMDLHLPKLPQTELQTLKMELHSLEMEVHTLEIQKLQLRFLEQLMLKLGIWLILEHSLAFLAD